MAPERSTISPTKKTLNRTSDLRFLTIASCSSVLPPASTGNPTFPDASLTGFTPGTIKLGLAPALAKKIAV
jgi:hypothetical protein